ncbi:MAG: hypothetical protein AAGG51_04830 [Cyanobacteria bacterium P01_G01_bin.54]
MVDKTKARPDLPNVEPYIEIRFYIENMYADFVRIQEKIEDYVQSRKKFHFKTSLNGQFFMNSILMSYHNLSYRLSGVFRIVSYIVPSKRELMEISRSLEKLNDQLDDNTDLERVFSLTNNYTEEKSFSANDLDLAVEKLAIIRDSFLTIASIPWSGTSALEKISNELLKVKEVAEAELIPLLEKGYYWVEWKVENEFDRQSLYSQALEESEKILERKLIEQEVDQVRAEIFGRGYDFWEVAAVAVDLLGDKEDFLKIPEDKIPEWWE